MANCLPKPLAASKGRALICEGTAFRATQEKGGCSFTRSCQRNEGIDLMRSNRVRARTIPKGLRPPAQGCEERATLGKRRSKMPPCHSKSAKSRPRSFSQRLETRFNSFTHSACVMVRPNRASRCTWSSTPPARMGGQSSCFETPPRYEWSASRVGLSRRSGRRSLVEKPR